MAPFSDKLYAKISEIGEGEREARLAKEKYAKELAKATEAVTSDLENLANDSNFQEIVNSRGGKLDIAIINCGGNAYTLSFWSKYNLHDISLNNSEIGKITCKYPVVAPVMIDADGQVKPLSISNITYAKSILGRRVWKRGPKYLEAFIEEGILSAVCHDKPDAPEDSGEVKDSGDVPNDCDPGRHEYSDIPQD